MLSGQGLYLAGDLFRDASYNPSMDKFYTKIVGTPVVEDDNLRPITTIKDVLIDPESGKLIALIVDLSRNLIITPIDILSWHDVIHVHGRDVIVEGNEVLRVEAVQKSGVKVFHNRVETKDGKYLGKVADFSVDTHLMDLKKLFIAKGFLALFRYESRIIPAKNILEILPEKIVVKDDLAVVKQEAKEKVAMEDMALT